MFVHEPVIVVLTRNELLSKGFVIFFVLPRRGLLLSQLQSHLLRNTLSLFSTFFRLSFHSFKQLNLFFEECLLILRQFQLLFCLLLRSPSTLKGSLQLFDLVKQNF